jgi:hypothetical protein
VADEDRRCTVEALRGVLCQVTSCSSKFKISGAINPKPETRNPKLLLTNEMSARGYVCWCGVMFDCLGW